MVRRRPLWWPESGGFHFEPCTSRCPSSNGHLQSRAKGKAYFVYLRVFSVHGCLFGVVEPRRCSLAPLGCRRVSEGSRVPVCTICPCSHPAQEGPSLHRPPGAAREHTHTRVNTPLPGAHACTCVHVCVPCPVPFAHSQESAFLTSWPRRALSALFLSGAPMPQSHPATSPFSVPDTRRAAP